MPIDPKATTYYRQARFTTRLPNAYRYSPAHYWINETEPGVLRIGMTKFATRMLGDFVEFHLQLAPGDRLQVGQPIGEIEGFKAISDIYAVADGEFVRANENVEQQPDLVDSDPYDRGWLYEVRGTADEQLLDVGGYIEILEVTIEKMLDESQKPEVPPC